MEQSGLTNILLIGSTGNGKSTLGNFLLDPSDDHILKNPTFLFASTNESKTKDVKIASKGDLSFVDTPGINEGVYEDLEHMIGVVKKLNELERISACILCVKFDSKIDMQYKATIAYYKQLLPQLFENNVLIVFTNYRTDARTLFDRQRLKMDEAAIISNAVHEVSKGLNYSPACFRIDGLPFGEEERSFHEEARSSILKFIMEQLRPVCVKNVLIAKTPFIVERCRKEIEEIKGEIKGAQNHLESKNKRKYKIIEESTSKSDQLSVAEQHLSEKKTQLQRLDSDDLVVGVVWNLEQKWKWFDSQTQRFKVTSDWPIVNYEKWDNGNLKWHDFEVGTYQISGEVKGRFMRGLYAKLTLQVRKNVKYACEIKTLQKEVSQKEIEIGLLKSELRYAERSGEKYDTEIKEYEKFITEKKERMNKASKDSMTVKEAEEMLKKLRIA